MLGVLRAVVGDQHRALSGGVRMGPDQGGQLRPEDLARDRHALRLAHRLRRRPSPAARTPAPPRRTCPPRGRSPSSGWPGRRSTRSCPCASSSSNWYSKRATSGAGAASSHDLPRRCQLVRQPVAELVGEADGRQASSRVGELEADFDHGSVSIACQFARRTGLWGRVGPFRTLGGARGRSYHDSSQLSRRNDDGSRTEDERSAQAVVAATALVAGRRGDRRGAQVEARRQRDQRLPQQVDGRAQGARGRCRRAAATSSRCSGTSAAAPGPPRARRARRPIAALRGTACTTVSGLPGVLVVRTEAGGVVTLHLPSRASLRGADRTWF